MTVSVILALALGIGANSAMFSVVDALILHPLRYYDPATLMVIRERDTQGDHWNGSDANFLDWRHAKSFSDIAGWVSASFVRTGIDLPEQMTGGAVTSNFFRTLGVKPVLGRTFLDGEDGVDDPANAARVVVLSNRFWQENMGADPNVLGRTLRLNSTSYAIIGVMPADFQFVGRQHQVWVPISLNRQNRDFHRLGLVVGRLAAPRERASAEMATIARALGEAYPKSNKGWTFEVMDFQEWLINRTFRTRLLLLFASVGLVLLIACTNVASLTMARSATRYREIAVRISLGATAGRLTRQLLTESVLLSLVGGALGLTLAWRLIAAAPAFVPPNTIPAAAPIELSPVVMFFTLAISVATGLLFGLAPALVATHPDVHEILKASSRSSTGGRSRQVFRQSMVAAEVAVALMLLASAGLMIRSLSNLTQSDLGFDPANVLTMRLFLPATRYDATRALAFHREAMQRISALPGVKSVAVATSLPLQRPTLAAPFDLVSSPARDEGDWPGVAYATISADYLRSLGIPVKRGRAFTEADNQNSPPVVIVNEAFVQHFFPNEDPVGKRILLARPKLPSGFEDAIRPEIVGIVGNVKLTDLTAPPEPVLYAPHSQNIWATTVYFAMRASIDPAGLTAAIRRELAAMDRSNHPAKWDPSNRRWPSGPLGCDSRLS